MAIAENPLVDLGKGFEKASQPKLDLADQDQASRRPRLDHQPLYGNHHAVQVGSNGRLNHHHLSANGGGDKLSNGGQLMGEKLKNGMRELQELFSELNPWAAEFVPPSLSSGNRINGQPYPSNGSTMAHSGWNGQVNGGAAGRRVSPSITCSSFLVKYTLFMRFMLWLLVVFCS